MNFKFIDIKPVNNINDQIVWDSLNLIDGL